MNAFDLKLAWWHIRGQARRFWLLIFCIALGVAARVSVGSFLGQLNRSLASEARNLLTADVELFKRTPFTGEERSALRDHLPPGSQTQDMLNFVTMAAARTRQTRLVEVRAVETGYPLYGTLQLSDQPAARRARLDKIFGEAPAAYVQQDLLPELGIRIGDKIRLGRADFTVAGTILQEPGLGGNIFALGPRVLIGSNQTVKTGLLDFGSRASYSILAALPDPTRTESVAWDLRGAWSIPDDKAPQPNALGPDPNAGLHLRTAKDKQAQLRRFFDRLGDFLRLVSLIALLLGGIGVGSVVRGFVLDNLESIAVLHTLGASSTRVAKVYLYQILGLSLSGSLLGAALGTGVQNLFPILLSGLMPVPVHMGIDPAAIFWGLGLGISISAYYALLPLMEIREIKPLSILRGDAVEDLRRIVLWLFVLGGSFLFGLVAAFEAHSPVLGALFGGALLGGGALIYLSGRLTLPRLGGFKRLLRGFGWRHGISNLVRPGLRPYSALVALGLSALLMGILTVYQHSLLQELDPRQRPEQLPNFFIIDIQHDQVEDLRASLRRLGAGKLVFSPLVKARYRSLNGQIVRNRRALTREGETEQRMRNREQNLSYRDQLGEDETLVRGRWMKPDSSETEASLEEWFAGQIGAKPGDRLAFDVQGVPIEARVTSIRKVHWTSFRPNFFILLSPSALREAPQTWVASVAGLGRDNPGPVQTELVRRFPNLTIFDVGRTSRKILEVIERISWAIHFMALFSLGAGLVVLVGIALASARQRRMEAALLKTLGAPRRTLVSSIAVEFGFLGLVATCSGFALAVGFSWLLLTKFLDVDFSVPWIHLGIVLVLLTALCALTGILACGKVFQAKPLEVLREI